MANKFTCPPQASGAGSFSNNLVGLQLVGGGGLTQGNFEFTQSASEKVDRTFITGTFSNPINLESLGLDNVNQSKTIVENNFKVYPNYDLSQISNFVLYGSLVKRMSATITTIISYFPAAIESTFLGLNYLTGDTATNISYNPTTDSTTFDLDLARIRNPFGIDFTVNSTRNLELREIEVSSLRNMTIEYANYSLYVNNDGYKVIGIIPTTSLTVGTLNLTVQGNPFSGESTTISDLIIRPNDTQVNKVFNEDFGEVENFLLNRNATPIYTSTYQIPREAEDGTFYIEKNQLTWTLYGKWNLDIITASFQNYLTKLNGISELYDELRTNLISRFLTTGALKEFDTDDQKVEKILQIYGRSFDEVNTFIGSLSFMTSVNYTVGNDIPSQLLKNLAQTLGWTTNISPITNDQFLSSVFGQNNQQPSNFTGLPNSQTPDELNYQFYRNIILNSAYLFKSKGTRKSIEILLKLIGAPDALVEFNEFIYLADQKINMNKFNTEFGNISGGTYVQQLPVLEPANTFTIFGVEYTGFTTEAIIQDVNTSIDEFPIDSLGYPKAPVDSESYFFQIGSGWFEQTPQHRGPEEVNITLSVFTGNNPNYQTSLLPFSYGQEYLNRFRKFPFMNLGYKLSPSVDNNKSWYDDEINLRLNLDGNINARYFVGDDKLVLNVKNTEIFLNPAQGLAYDVWYLSRELNYPIPNEGMNFGSDDPCDPCPIPRYPYRGDVDWTELNPKPKSKSFFEFAQTFWRNMINVRNRQYSFNGKTGGYPTLESIYWRYLESENVNITNNNFTYQTMIDYVNGLGDYWIRLIEQMVPATTIFNTGIKYENSIFHRQKFVWKRQRGCQIITVEETNPCECIQLTFKLKNPTSPTTFKLTPNGYFNNRQSYIYTDLTSGNVLLIRYNSSLSRWEFFINNIEYGYLDVDSVCPVGKTWISEKFIISTEGVDCGPTKQRPPLCRPCELNDNLYRLDCPVESVECPIYPWDSNPNVTTFGSVLGNVLNTYLATNGTSVGNCDLNSMTTIWYVDLRVNNTTIVSYPFFNGIGYNIPTFSTPSVSDWDIAIIAALEELKNYGYNYYLTDNDTVVVYSESCSISDSIINFKINVGINFQIYCS
jgi:hypothetical protein